MNSYNLTREQRADLAARLQQLQNQLGVLFERMNERRFPTDDPVWRATRAAHRSMINLVNAVRESGSRSSTI